VTYEEIVKQYSKQVYETAYLYLRNREAAEDLTQEVFFSYYKNASQFREEASLKTYLIRITLNKCYDYQRSWKNQAHLWIEQVILKEKKEVEEAAIHKERSQNLLSEISKLKPKYREVIILYYYHELFVKEIALLLNVAENTIHTRLKRAKEQLKWQLKEEAIFYEKSTARRNS
jgi:RNA polymerase sigma factor (sigma-70 family)